MQVYHLMQSLGEVGDIARTEVELASGRGVTVVWEVVRRGVVRNWASAVYEWRVGRGLAQAGRDITADVAARIRTWQT